MKKVEKDGNIEFLNIKSRKLGHWIHDIVRDITNLGHFMIKYFLFSNIKRPIFNAAKFNVTVLDVTGYTLNNFSFDQKSSHS